MTLPYIEYNLSDLNEHGVFINHLSNNTCYINPSLSGHDADCILKTFRTWFNPNNIYFYDREEALEVLKDNIEFLSDIENISSDEYFNLKLYKYFYDVYSSDKTKINVSSQDKIDLSLTTSYTPKYFYCYHNVYNRVERLMDEEDEIDILKSILVQSCDVDSIELVWPNTICTSKFNIYETFYNYLIMDYNVQIVPKRIFNEEKGVFIDYKYNEFLVPDSELRLKDEIISIRKLVKKDERYKYFK